jgi:hypothetical protein
MRSWTTTSCLTFCGKVNVLRINRIIPLRDLPSEKNRSRDTPCVSSTNDVDMLASAFIYYDPSSKARIRVSRASLLDLLPDGKTRHKDKGNWRDFSKHEHSLVDERKMIIISGLVCLWKWRSMNQMRKLLESATYRRFKWINIAVALVNFDNKTSAEIDAIAFWNN